MIQNYTPTTGNTSVSIVYRFLSLHNYTLNSLWLSSGVYEMNCRSSCNIKDVIFNDICFLYSSWLFFFKQQSSRGMKTFIKNLHSKVLYIHAFNCIGFSYLTDCIATSPTSVKHTTGALCIQCVCLIKESTQLLSTSLSICLYCPWPNSLDRNWSTQL